MNDILFLEPIFKERIWGGHKLETDFGYKLPFKHTGECWAISAHPNGDCKITNGRFKGKTLSEVFKSNKELFDDYPSDRFPLLTKILDAHDDLSVQVHPDDTYALKHFNDLGKNECWYVLDADKDAYIIFGHKAQSKQAFEKMINDNQWDNLLVKKYVKKGDFIYVPAGAVHAIGKGLLILETQQSSDTTFRLYDYARKDDQGHERQLHIKEAIEVSTTPFIDKKLEQIKQDIGPHKLIELVQTPYFEVEKWDINGTLLQLNDNFFLMSIIEGKGTINGLEIKKGDHLVVTTNVEQVEFDGIFECIISRP